MGLGSTNQRSPIQSRYGATALLLGVVSRRQKVAELVAELHQHTVTFGDKLPTTRLLTPKLLTARNLRTKTKEGFRTGNRKTLATQIVEGCLVQLLITV